LTTVAPRPVQGSTAGAVIPFPARDSRMMPFAAAPADAMALVACAIERIGTVADLVGQAAPAPEITAAAEAVAALRAPLASLQMTARVLLSARAAGEAEARDAALRSRTRLRAAAPALPEGTPA